jgi:hypothetical protein
VINSGFPGLWAKFFLALGYSLENDGNTQL